MPARPAGRRAGSTPEASGSAVIDPQPTVRVESTRRLGEFVFAALAVALGVFTLVGAFAIRVPGAASAVGPRVFPFLVSAILIGSAAMVLIDVARGRLGAPEESEDVDERVPTDWVTLAKLTGFLVAHMVLIDLVGWPVAAGILFGGVAWSLGAKRWWLALGIGLALTFLLQFVFGSVLGLSLPLLPSWLR